MKGKKTNLIIKNKERLCTRAPMRVSFAGGGTDINHYFQKYSGAVINATICKFAYAEICLADQTFIAESLDFKRISF